MDEAPRCAHAWLRSFQHVSPPFIQLGRSGLTLILYIFNILLINSSSCWNKRKCFPFPWIQNWTTISFERTNLILSFSGRPLSSHEAQILQQAYEASDDLSILIANCSMVSSPSYPPFTLLCLLCTHAPSVLADCHFPYHAFHQPLNQAVPSPWNTLSTTLPPRQRPFILETRS